MVLGEQRLTRLGPHRVTAKYYDGDRARMYFQYWLVVTVGGWGTIEPEVIIVHNSVEASLQGKPPLFRFAAICVAPGRVSARDVRLASIASAPSMGHGTVGALGHHLQLLYCQPIDLGDSKVSNVGT